MSRWNQHMTSHFSSCRLLATSHDHCRQRNVRIYMLPGEFTVVGVSDGTDAWIAPVAADPFSVHVGRILQGIQEGKEVERPRVRVNLPHLAPRPVQQPPAQTEPVAVAPRKERVRVRITTV